MQAIHFKTMDPISQNLLRSASQRGIDLGWERYEKLQPQDGFLRLGLSCPYGCMEGPCRIDPFGRGADRGLCGLDRDGMVAAFLLRLSLQGVLESGEGKAGRRVFSEKSWSSPLKGLASRALRVLGGSPLSSEEIFQGTLLLQRPKESPDRLIEQALRLGILSVALSDREKPQAKGTKKLDLKVGYGLLEETRPFIGVTGYPSGKVLSSLIQEASRKSAVQVQVLSLGDWIPMEKGFLPFACTSGEAELLLSSGKIHLLFAGSKTDTSLLTLCRNLDIPLVLAEESPDAAETLRLARKRFSVQSQTKLVLDPSLTKAGRITQDPQGLKNLIKKGSSGKLTLIGGADTLHQSMGWLPGEVARTLGVEGYHVASWGDAALWMIKNGLSSGREASPVTILDPSQGPLLALKALASGSLGDLRGICFVGLRACQDLTMALGLAAVGTRVCVAVPLPLWGSEKVRNLLAEKLEATGGTLTHFDHPADPQEIVKWFQG